MKPHTDILRLLLMVLMIVILIGSPSAADVAPHQALINPDFSQPLIGDDPPGWFRAMMPAMTEKLDSGRAEEDGQYYLYLTQHGPQANLFNNWAQRLDDPPISATLTLTAEIRTQNVTGPGAAALIMLFDANDATCAVASSEGELTVTDNSPWTPVTLETTVPPSATTAIVRFGLLPGSEGTLHIRRASLMVENGVPPPAPGQTELPGVLPQTAQWHAGFDLLANGNFESDVVLGNPAGWFRAMLPDMVTDFQAGVEPEEGRGKVAFIEQAGLKARVVNNWAQRLEVVPIGARLRLQADVKTRDLPENTGFVMIQCWGTDDRLLAAATSQTSQPLGGTEDWKTVSCEVAVPDGTQTIIVRCGLANSGRIWFDNVSLTIIEAPPARAAAAMDQPPPPVESGHRTQPGVRVDAAYEQQLAQARVLLGEVEAAARAALPPGADMRTEIFALGDGKFDVVMHLDLSMVNNTMNTPELKVDH